MRRWLLRLAIPIGGLVGLWLVAGLVARGLVSGSSRNALISSLEQSLGAAVSVGAADFDFAQWLLLRPAISLDNLTVGNPPGFHSRYLLEARKLAAQISLLPLLHKSLEVHSIEIDQPRVLVETNAQGVTNVEAFFRKSGSKAASRSGGARRSDPETGSVSGLVIDELAIKSGAIAVYAANASEAAEDINIHSIDLRLRDFSSDRASKLQVSARLFGGKVSMLRVDGQAGPFTAESLPLAATLSVTIAPGEIPEALRRKQFGSLLAAPGEGKATLEASIRGDVYQTLRGPAKLVLSGIPIGKDEKHVLPVVGEAPLTFSAAKLMSSPTFHLNMSNARLRLSKGEWTGDAEVQVRAAMASGKTSGKIHGVEINEMVSSLTAANEKIYGLLEIPSYTLQFAGKNADEIRNSLHGAGKLSVTQGRIAALDLLSSIQQVALNPQQALEGKKGATPFSTLAADLNVGQSKLNVDGLTLDSPALRLTGHGVIDFDHHLNFDLIAHVSGGLSQLVSRVSKPGQDGGLPLTVTGTVDSPQVRPNAGKMVQSAVGGLLDSFLKKKK